MIESYQNIAINLIEINKKLQDRAHFQKIFTTSKYICMQIRIPGETLFLYIGRGQGYEGIRLGEKLKEPILKRKDRLIDLIKNQYLNLNLNSIEQDSDDRILKFNFSNSQGEMIYFFWGWIGRSSCFISQIQDKEYLTSWNSGNRYAVSELSFNLFNVVGRKKLEVKDDKFVEVDMNKLLQEEKNELEKKNINKKIPKDKNKRKNIENDLIQINNFLKLEKIIPNIDENFWAGNPELYTFENIKIKFEKSATHYQKINKVFEKIKAYKRAKILQEKRLSQINEQQLEKKFIFENKLKLIQPLWLKNAIKKIDEKKDEFSIREFDDFVIGWGASDIGNDQVRKWGNDNDLWVHLDSKTSSHAIIKLKDQSKLINSLTEASKLIYGNTLISNTQIDIVYTLLKNVKPIKGKAGLVKYTKEKKMRIYVD